MIVCFERLLIVDGRANQMMTMMMRMDNDDEDDEDGDDDIIIADDITVTDTLHSTNTTTIPHIPSNTIENSNIILLNNDTIVVSDKKHRFVHFDDNNLTTP